MLSAEICQGEGSCQGKARNKTIPNSNGSPPLCAGVVREVGEEVTDLSPGDRVWFTVPSCLQAPVIFTFSYIL
jgi:Zn-dependent alcohol dehydrogenase